MLDHSFNNYARFLPVPLLIGLVAACVIVPILHWGLLLFIPLLALALWDFFQRRHTLMRNYPLMAHVRWLMEDLRPYLRSYIVEGDREGRPFTHDQRALIYARSKGDLDSHPMGTELDVYSSEYEWMTHSIAPRPDAPEQWRVDVGSSQCTRPYSASLLNISAMSFGSLGGNAIQALNLGAARGNFFHDTGEGAISKYHRKYGGDLVWEIGSGYFGCRSKDGRFEPEAFRDAAADDQVKMIEIKLSQGAKPGHGGVLPAPKVSPEIAETRGIPVGVECISPPAHSAFSTPIELCEFVAQLRELAGGKPVGIKLCVGKPHEVFALMKAMLETEIRIDFIVVDGAEGGTGAAPVELSNRVGMPLREGLICVRNALVGTGLKQDVKVGASGKLFSGVGIAQHFALGADWTNAARAFMFSLGCIQSMNCHTGHCPTGVATMDPTRQRGLVVADKAERVARFQRKTLHAFREIVIAMGINDPWEIRPHHFHARTSSTRSYSIDRIYSFLEERALLDSDEDLPYSHYWRAARSDSFRAATDITMEPKASDPNRRV